MAYNLLMNGVYWGYNPFTNLLPTSWDIQVNLFHLLPVQGHLMPSWLQFSDHETTKVICWIFVSPKGSENLIVTTCFFPELEILSFIYILDNGMPEPSLSLYS